MPDAEALIRGYLLDVAAVEDLVGDRICSTMPTSPVFPLVRLTRIGGTPPMSSPLWVDRPLIQLDAFGGPSKTAWQIAATCQAALAAAESLVLDAGVISSVRVGAIVSDPDASYTPAKPRYRLDFSPTVRPLRASEQGT